MLAEETPASFVAFDLLAEGKTTCGSCRSRSDGRSSRRCSASVDAAGAPHADHARSRAGARSGSTRSRAPASTASSPRSSTGDVQGRRARLAQGQAPAHRRLRRRRVPDAQGRQGRRLAAARSLQRRRQAPARRRRVELQRARAARSSSTSSRRTAPTRSKGHPWAEWGGAGGPRGRRPHAGRAEPLEREEGHDVGAAAHRARRRGRVRAPAARPLPPHRPLPALAPRPRARARAPTSSSRSPSRWSSKRSSAADQPRVLRGDVEDGGSAPTFRVQHPAGMR